MGDKKTDTARIEIVGGPNCGEIFESDFKFPQKYFSIRNATDIKCDHADHIGGYDESDDGVLAVDPFAEWVTYEKRYRDMETGYYIFTPRDPQVVL
ncbi:hypothetical protein [Pseudarthrobacter chlorophenolicus]|uniref:hypothetical protein n=1 Tax=Pseudarthrobacter chlorophenolicus TaxID=85085 RepID=UPI0005F2EFCD|nr:hypothetical protein [Pseudarthrobacter chlorophenolicus]